MLRLLLFCLFAWAECPTPTAAASGDVDPATVAADFRPDWNRETLTGDWDGLRTALYGRGIEVGASHKSDWMRDTGGGLRTGGDRLSYTELHFAIDGEKLIGWDNTSAFIYYHFASGGKFNRDHVGAQIGVDNIEVRAATGQFFDAWVQRRFFDDRLSLLFGLYHIDSEFYVTETSAIFLQPPYGIANEVGQSGTNGPPIYPIGALALRAKTTTSGHDFYLQTAVTDGVPGDPENPRGTHVELNRGDGSFVIAEIGHAPQGSATAECEGCEAFDKTAIGYWRYTSHLPGFGATDRRVSEGAYALTERTLWHDLDHPGRALSGFARFGKASGAVNALDWSGSLGLRCRGPLTARPDDIAGVAVTVNHAGDPYRNSRSVDSSETAFEATYRVALRPWLAVQPTLQHLTHPGLDPALRSARVVGVRIEVRL